MECFITITGPGQVINNELAVIRKALKDAGYEVHVNNPHPFKDDRSDEHIVAFITEHNNKNPPPKFNGVKIEMNHEPWGG